MPPADAHKGISHPFGAPHPNSSEGGLGRIIMMLSSKKSKATSNQPVQRILADPPKVSPQSANYRTPGAERLGQELDPVGAHSRTNHDTLQPYTPDPTGPKHYYTLGVRPLDYGRFVYGFPLFLRDQHMEHMQFLANNGENFGMLNFDDGVISSDDENLTKYQILPQKYNAQLIDRARKLIEAEEPMRSLERQRRRDESVHGSRYPGKAKRYFPYGNNCQDYIQQVIKKAQQLETPYDPLVIP